MPPADRIEKEGQASTDLRLVQINREKCNPSMDSSSDWLFYRPRPAALISRFRFFSPLSVRILISLP